MKRCLLIFLAVLMILSSLPVYVLGEDPDPYKIVITEEKLSNGNVEFSGSVTGLSSALSLDLKVKEDNNADYYSAEITTAANGLFSGSFPVSQNADETHTYEYTLSQKIKPDVATEVFSDDYSSGRKDGYVTYGEVSDEIGNDAPSVNMGAADTRIIWSTSGVTSGIYSISADLLIQGSRQVFGTYNRDGSAGNANNALNKEHAYKIYANSSNQLILEYATTDSNQTEASEVVIASYSSDTWINIKVEINIGTKELRVFVGNTRVCESTPMYIFAQKDYNRIFSTGYRETATCYLDNLIINKITRDTDYGIAPVTGEFIKYSTQDYVDAVAAVNDAATREEMKETLEGKSEILGIDFDAYNALTTTEGKNSVLDALLAAEGLVEPSDVYDCYTSALIFAQIKECDVADRAALIKAKESELKFFAEDGFYADTALFGSINVSINSAEGIEDIKEILKSAALIYELKSADEDIVVENEAALRKYGYIGAYTECSPQVRAAILTEIQGYSFKTNIGVVENLCEFSDFFNEVYNRKKAEDHTYTLGLTKQLVVENELFVEGSISPAIAYDFNLTAYDGATNSAEGKFKTEKDGSFSTVLTLPEKAADNAYTIKIEPVHPAEVLQTYLDDGEFTDTTKYPTANDGRFEVTTIDGNKVVKPIKTDKTGRLLFQEKGLNSLESGELIASMDFMIADDKGVSKLFAVTDINSTLFALNAYIDTDKHLNLTYVDEDNTNKTVVLMNNVDVNHWYNLKYSIDMATKKVKVFLDGIQKTGVTLGDSVTDIARIIDSEMSQGEYYLDNLKCYMDNSGKKNVKEELFKINVAGTARIADAMAALKVATSANCKNVLDTYVDVFSIDTSSLSSINAVSDALDSYISVEEKNSGVAAARKGYFATLALWQAKEATDASNCADIIYTNQQYFDETVEEAVKNSTIFKNILVTNIGAISNIVEFNEFLKDTVLLTNVKRATQTTAYAIIDGAIAKCEAYGLNTSYKSFDEAKRKAVAVGALAEVSSYGDPKELLKEAMKGVNDKIIDYPNITPPKSDDEGGSVGSGGGGGGMSYTAEIVEDEIKDEISNTATSRFSDVTQSHWAYEPIEELCRMNILNGKSPKSFDPEAYVTREEFVKMIIAAIGDFAEGDEVELADVEKGSWYAPYVAEGIRRGIINGIGDNKFGVGMSVTREDAAVIIYRGKDLLNEGIVAHKDNISFTDAEDISEYAIEGVSFLAKSGIINGMGDNSFCPIQPLTRAQAAKIIYETIKR